MAASKNKRTPKKESACTEFKSILRLRPLLKKERDDNIVVEPVCDTTSIVSLHPMQRDSTGSGMIGSPETIHTAHDIDFNFDRVLPCDTNQDKAYLSIGLPLALEAMEALRAEADLPLPKKSHLVIGIGHSSSGKTFSCIGDRQNISARKSETDGLIPRMLDSLFSQSKHNVHKKKMAFAVNISIIQINQSKINPSECQLHDLLQSMKKSAGAFSASKVASNILGSLDMSNVGPNGKSTMTKSSDTVSVEVHQDPKSSECVLINHNVRSYANVESARESLQIAMERSRKLCHKNCQSHLLVQIQPVLLDKHAKVIHGGGCIAVLDMASYEGGRQRSGRLKDSLPNRDDAHTAVLHCLRTIQHNESIQNKNVQLKETAEDPMSTTKLSMKKIPFLQNKVTMLLQPLFSAQHVEITNVVLLLTVSPSHRDYDEKRDLLNEIESVHRPIPCLEAMTGTKKSVVHRKNERKLEKTSTKKIQQKKLGSASDADDEGSRDKQHHFHILPDNAHEKVLSRCKESQMARDDSFSNDEYIEPLPPPVAPGYAPDACFREQRLSSSDPSTRYVSPISTADFPGVSMLAPPSTFISTPASTESRQRKATCPNMKASAPVEDSTSDHHYDGIYGSHATHLLNYMKTFNKVVNASKKKGRQVMEKISVSTSNGNSCNKDAIVAELERRMAKVEKKNAKLIRENEWLREQNARLEKENIDLKLSWNGCHDEYLSTPDCESVESECSSVESAASLCRNHEKVGCSKNGEVDLSDLKPVKEASASDHRPFRTSNTFDDPFFKHMAEMDDDNRWDKGSKEDRSHGGTQCFLDDNDENAMTIEGEAQRGPDQLFNDPVFEHLAQLDKW